MKVEIVSISARLLMSDVLDTHAAYVSRTLHELEVGLTAKVTVGDDPVILKEILDTALRRADAVITLGGLNPPLLPPLLSQISDQPLVPLGSETAVHHGFYLGLPTAELYCLPSHRRDMISLLETAVLPRLRQQKANKAESDWLLLHCVGLMASQIRERLRDLPLAVNQQLFVDSFAGLTTLRLWASAADLAQVTLELQTLKAQVMARLGTAVYGEGQTQLEETVWQALLASGRRLAVAEFHTDGVVAQSLRLLAEGETLTAVTWPDAVEGSVDPAEVARWAASAVAHIHNALPEHLVLLVYQCVLPGGMHILSLIGDGQTTEQQSHTFNGRPTHWRQWVNTLALSHLRHWLLAHTHSI